MKQKYYENHTRYIPSIALIVWIIFGCSLIAYNLFAGIMWVMSVVLWDNFVLNRIHYIERK